MVLRVKITILGEPSVGKTSIVSKYCNNQFLTEYRATLGADFTSKQIRFHSKFIEIILWDIAGTSSFEIERLSDFYLQGSLGYFLVYDLMAPKSLKKLTFWHEKAKRVCGDIPYIILGNKNDLKRLVQEKQDKNSDQEVLQKMGIYEPILKTSAKSGENVELAMMSLLELILKVDEK
jgi:small GTP-binding protein